MRHAARILLSLTASAGLALLATGFVIHFTVRDTLRGSATLFYMLPLPVLAGLAAFLALYWARRKQRLLPVLLAIASLAAFALWLREGWHWAPPPTARGALRVVHWNIDRPDRLLPGVLAWLRAQDADVILIAERFPYRENLLARWQAAFPEYQIAPASEEMLCLVRGEILARQDRLVPHASYATLFQTRIRGREISILQVDIQAAPLRDRTIPLRRLAEIAAAHRAGNLLIAGDFNTPLESTRLAGLRAEATNAFEAAGHGCAATWPRLPLLSLDQIWSNPRLRPVRCELHASWRSDHRAVVAEFDFMP